MDENVKTAKSGKHVLEVNPRTNYVVTVVYLIVLALLFLAIVISLIVIKHNENIRAQAVEAYKAELLAKQEEESAQRMEEIRAEAEQRKIEIELFCKLFEGVRRFNYSAEDLMTYGWCVYNRVDSPLYPNTVADVIYQKNQWVAFSDDNVVVSDYYKIAERLVAERHGEDPRPCTTDFLWAELADDGIFLKNSVEPGKSARTCNFMCKNFCSVCNYSFVDERIQFHVKPAKAHADKKKSPFHYG